MPIVSIDWYEGRTVEQKKKIAEKIIDTVVEVTGCPADAVSVIFNDKAKCDIVKGGQ
jgi:4-oxalocrotonate tautomerase